MDLIQTTHLFDFQDLWTYVSLIEEDWGLWERLLLSAVVILQGFADMGLV